MFCSSRVQRGSRSCPRSRINPSLVVMSRLLQFVSGVFIVCRKSTPPLGQMESKEEIPRLVSAHLSTSCHMAIHPTKDLNYSWRSPSSPQWWSLAPFGGSSVKLAKFRCGVFWTSLVTIKSTEFGSSHLFPPFIPIQADLDHNLAVKELRNPSPQCCT